MTEGPAVTVVIPTHNRWPLLTRALAGALGQQEVRLEVIVVDDASQDGTPDELARHRDPRVRCVRLERNRGVAHARNLGIREARGEWLAFLDDDDQWSPAKLRLQLAAAQRARAAFAYGAAVHVDERGTVIAFEPAPEPCELAPRLLTDTNPIPAGGSNVLARTSLVRHVGGFDERLFHLADWELWIRLVESGRAVACPEVLVAYLKHPANMLTVPGRDILAEFEYLAAKHHAKAAARGLSFDATGLTRWVASGHGGAGRRRQAARAYLRGALARRSAADALRAVRVLVSPRAARPRRAATTPAVSPPPWLRCE